jgi:hypothetical protein
MCHTWIEALDKYNWQVDLASFQHAREYLGFFNRTITPAGLGQFETDFRASLKGTGHYQIAGEVCFWKNYGNHLAKNRLPEALLTHLSVPGNWTFFVEAVRNISQNPTFSGFDSLCQACGQPNGFAVPMTFVAFYDPLHFPMVDKHIAYWWKNHRSTFGHAQATVFSQRNDGWIQTTNEQNRKQNWTAYLDWKAFCCEYAERLTERCGNPWRARDVEMAVWMAQRNNLALNGIPQF